jgi:hypothetical protein
VSVAASTSWWAWTKRSAGYRQNVIALGWAGAHQRRARPCVPADKLAAPSPVVALDRLRGRNGQSVRRARRRCADGWLWCACRVEREGGQSTDRLLALVRHGTSAGGGICLERHWPRCCRCRLRGGCVGSAHRKRELWVGEQLNGAGIGGLAALVER